MIPSAPLVLSQIENVVRQTVLDNAELIQSNCHEVSISAKIMCALSNIYPDWDVDVEYNRDLNDVKKLFNGHGLRPDVIIHNRGKKGPQNNYIVMEIKKCSSKAGRNFDLEKLIEMTDQSGRFQYQFGVFVNIKSPEEIEFIYAQNGVSMNSTLQNSSGVFNQSI